MRVLALSLLLATGSVAKAADVDVVVTDATGRALEGAVAWLVPTGGTAALPSPARAIIDQRGRQFVPRVSVVQTGASVEFPNSDNIRHSVYSFSTPKPFTLKLYSGRPAAPVSFDKPGVVLLGCNIHDTMVAWIAVVDSAWFGRSDAGGRLTLRGVPAGPYQLHLWHPGQLQAVAPRALDVAPNTPGLSLQLDATDIATLIKAAVGHGSHGESS